MLMFNTLLLLASATAAPTEESVCEQFASEWQAGLDKYIELAGDGWFSEISTRAIKDANAENDESLAEGIQTYIAENDESSAEGKATYDAIQEAINWLIQRQAALPDGSRAVRIERKQLIERFPTLIQYLDPSTASVDGLVSSLGKLAMAQAETLAKLAARQVVLGMQQIAGTNKRMAELYNLLNSGKITDPAVVRALKDFFALGVDADPEADDYIDGIPLMMIVRQCENLPIARWNTD